MWSYPSKHWNSYIVQGSKHFNLGPIFYTLKFWSHRSKHWNSGPIFMHIGILILSFQTLEFWPFFYKHCISYLIHPLQTLKFVPYPSNHFNFGPLFIHIRFLMLCFKTYGFWPYFFLYWNYDIMVPKNGILALFL